jgi:hypothetical protein
VTATYNALTEAYLPQSEQKTASLTKGVKHSEQASTLNALTDVFPPLHPYWQQFFVFSLFLLSEEWRTHLKLWRTKAGKTRTNTAVRQGRERVVTETFSF